MRKIVTDSVLLAVPATVALAAVLVFASAQRGLAADAYLLFLGALALLSLVRATGRAHPRSGRSPLDRALRVRPVRPERPRELAALERQVVLASGGAFDLHYRLRPLLREIAAHRLALRGLELDADGEAALRAETWELLRGDREAPDQAWGGPGLGAAELRAVIEELERI